MADDVRARKLQPIYNALDARNYKMAIKLCAKKDLERWDIVKTLKAHALERLGRVEEALEVCAEVAARKPTDETVRLFFLPSLPPFLPPFAYHHRIRLVKPLKMTPICPSFWKSCKRTPTPASLPPTPSSLPPSLPPSFCLPPSRPPR